MKILESKDKRIAFMKMVYEWASFSKDPRTKIGAVIVRDDVPISVGFNNFPRKVLDFEERYANREEKYKFVCHAEVSAITNAARIGCSTLGATMFTQGQPCNECCKSVINCGIKRIVLHKQWPNLIYSEHWVKSNEISKIMTKEAGIEIEWLDCILGTQGFLDGKVIEV